MYYVLFDHLSSLTAIVNAATSVVENYSFNAWGIPRDATNWTLSYTGDLFAGRGFTVHEHLMDFNLINMNGRVCDPVLGRFLSPDPYVQMPGYPNSYNRYTYCLNNPLIYTDPDGEWINFLIGGIIGGITGYISGRVAGLRGGELAGFTLGATVIGAVSGGFASGVSSTVTAAFGAGANAFTVGAVSGVAGGAVGGFIGGAGMAGLSNGYLGTDVNMLNAGLKGALVGGIAGGTLGGITGGLQNQANDLTFFGGELTGDNFLAYEYTHDILTGAMQKVSDLGGADLHFYHHGYHTDAGTAFKWWATTMIEGKNTINVFRYWQSASSTISSFSAPAAGLTGFFLEPKGPSTTERNKNRRVPESTYRLTPNVNSYPNDYMIYNNNVPSSRGITMHSGNFPGDTRGCLLPGSSWSGGNAVSSSLDKLNELRQYINNTGYQKVRLNIYDLF